MAEEKQTVAGAFKAIENHERLCSERYARINEKLHWVLRGLAVLFFGLLGWMAVQLYALEPLRVAAQHQQLQPAPAGVAPRP